MKRQELLQQLFDELFNEYSYFRMGLYVFDEKQVKEIAKKYKVKIGKEK
jgi:hypothetical protein